VNTIYTMCFRYTENQER